MWVFCGIWLKTNMSRLGIKQVLRQWQRRVHMKTGPAEGPLGWKRIIMVVKLTSEFFGLKRTVNTLEENSRDPCWDMIDA